MAGLGNPRAFAKCTLQLLSEPAGANFDPARALLPIDARPIDVSTPLEIGNGATTREHPDKNAWKAADVCAELDTVFDGVKDKIEDECTDIASKLTTKSAMAPLLGSIAAGCTKACAGVIPSASQAVADQVAPA